MQEFKRKAIIPVNWPWADKFNRPMNFIDWLKSRKFSLVYLAGIWSVIGILGYGSTLHCIETWQLAFICDQAIWMQEMISDPLQFILSLLTAPWFHNGLDHIMLVTVVGFVIIVQSFEINYGTKAAAIMFFLLVFITGVFSGLCFNLARQIWPDHDFVTFAFSRNWMGGSAGFYGVFGSLLQKSRKPWIGLIFVAAFETFTHNMFGISLQINLLHLSAVVFGFVIWGLWLRYGNHNYGEQPFGSSKQSIVSESIT